MKQLKIANAYNATEEIIQSNSLSINAKWVLYNLRKELSSCFEFYFDESRELFSKYETVTNGKTIKFNTPEEATEYKLKQDEIDNFEIEFKTEKQQLKLSDIPNITVQQIELLDDFIEFLPE